MYAPISNGGTLPSNAKTDMRLARLALPQTLETIRCREDLGWQCVLLASTITDNLREACSLGTRSKPLAAAAGGYVLPLQLVSVLFAGHYKGRGKLSFGN